MKRLAGALLLAAGVTGCMSVERGLDAGGPMCGRPGQPYMPQTIPGVTGPWGEGVMAQGPYQTPATARQTAYMLRQSVPLNMAQMTPPTPGGSSGVVQASANMPAMPT
ncbi:MAG: hypothetical protein IT429_04145, partial [Gemmataceae bacterium]|nr:hypothetical protein [Gemmataceae bacterium]